MGSIKYYQLAKDEELPDEFCAVRDIGGEPSEYMFYVPESENAKLREDMEDLEGYNQMLRDRLRQVTKLQFKAEAENTKLRELVGQYHSAMRCMLETGTWPTDPAYLEEQMRELGIEVG